MEPAVYVIGLTKRFDETLAVRGLDLRVAPGTVYGLIGPDGAGKTTAMRMLAGLIEPDAGDARVAGCDAIRELAKMHERIGYMPQQYSLYGDLSVIENLRFFAGMYGVPRKVRAAREERLLAISRLAEFVDRPAAALSGGMYKKLALSCALIHEPQVLLLDEPTNGVDPISRRELWAFLHELVGGGITVVVSTPYMDEAERCDVVGLMIDGVIAAEGTPRELREGLDEVVYELRTDAPHKAREALMQLAGLRRVYSMGRRIHLAAPRDADVDGPVRARLAEEGIAIDALVAVEPSFEDVFLSHAQRAREGGSHAA